MKKREKTKMANIGNQRGSINTDPTDNKSMIRKYHEQMYAHKFYSLDKMDRFLLRHNLSMLTEEDIDNPNNPIPIKEVVFVVKNLPRKKMSGPYSFTGEFYQTFKKEAILILHKLSSKKKVNTVQLIL